MAQNRLVPLRQELLNNVLVLWIDNPPVNALGHPLRAALSDAFDQARDDMAVKAIVLLAAGRTFPAGADISEFGKKPKDPLLPDLCNLIEACPKPVVAGIHGSAVGGGLELALAAHQRVALASARLGLPEVTLGILPGAGGTQRVPRLIGAEHALRLMLTGAPVSAPDALNLGLLDKVVEQDLPAAAIAMAQAMIDSPALVPTRDRTEGMRDPAANLAAVAQARKAITNSRLPAPPRIIDCIEAALLLPFDQGLIYERAAFADLVTSPEAEALRHAFFAERRIAKMPGARTTPQPVNSVAIFGSGPEAAPLALAMLGLGHEVTLVEADEAALAPTLEQVALRLQQDVAKNRLNKTEHDARWERLQPSLSESLAASADLFFMTGNYSRPGEKYRFPQSGSSVPIVTLGRVGIGGINALGLAMPAGPEKGGLAELLVSDTTSPEAIATVLTVLRKLGMLVVQGQGSGIGSAVMSAFHASLAHFEAKLGAYTVLELRHRWGMVTKVNGDAPKPKIDSDLFGGIAAPVLGAMANAGLRLLGEGKALRPSDIDAVMLLGYGFPRWGGGPMLWAARRGHLVLRRDLEQWAEDAPDIWTPAPLLDELIREGVSLAQLNDD